MSTSEEIMNELKVSGEVVRLKVEGASCAVNTLRDQQTALGVSLVCPFPSLEVDVPVSFGASADSAMHRGAIHRIAVEDDPETGLPRLRLSIRTTDTSRATVVAEPAIEVLDEASRRTALPEPETAKTNDSMDMRLSDLFGPGESATAAIASAHNEPPWVKCGDLPMPEVLAERSRSRRSYKLAGRAAWLAVAGVLVAGGYFLDQAGVIDARSIRNRIAGFSLDGLGVVQGGASAPAPLERAAAAPAAAAVRSAEVVKSSVMTVAAKPVAAAVASLARDTDSEAVLADEEIPAETTPAETESADPAQAPAAEPAAPAVASSETGEALAPGEVTLLLPTRWPVEYVTGYRVRDPNGVVVDVPGGLVKREGWLENLATAHPMVRSVKAVQRETGARFIIFVHGELPRFVTSPKSDGVALRLFYPVEGVDPGADPTATIASLR